MTPTHALAVETDTLLADLHKRKSLVERDLKWTLDSLQRLIGNRHSVHTDSPERQERIDGLDAHVRRRWDQGMTEADALRSTIKHLTDEIEDLNAVWNMHDRWSRFFIVQNVGGHIHSSLNCSTCRWDTSFAWLPTLSGLTEAEAVEAHGAILCSVCFPSAPVEWTNGTSKASQAAKAERDAAKQAREDKRLAKALLPDGSPLVVQQGRYSEDIVTLAAAKAWLTDSYDACRNRDPESLRAVSEAVAAKNGTTAAAEIAAAKARAAKRR